MNGWHEYAGALQTGLLSALQRPRHLILAAAGFLIASATVLVLLTLPAGLDKLAGDTGSNDIVVVIPKGISEGAHHFAPDQVQALKTLPGVAQGAQGRPLVAPQFVAFAKLRHNDGQPGTVLLRGITPALQRLTGSSVHLTDGHWPRTGHDEFVAGAGAAASYVALAAGDQNRIHHRLMRSTGIFRAGTGFWNSEIWMSQDVLQSLYNSPATITSVWVKLTSPAQFPAFLKALGNNHLLAGVNAVRQRDYYAAQTQFLSHFVHIAIASVAIALGLGAILAIANALGLALNARRHELAIMRATGYRQAPLAWALLTEVWVLAVLCVAIVAIFGFLFWNGHAIDSSTLFQAIQFKANISGNVIGWTLAYTLIIGTLSALSPIRRVIRAPLVDALRNT